jgi:rhodanese-related sulfurtransferase
MQTETIDGATLESWTPQEVAEAFARNAIILIDVRTPQEFAFERIGGALLAPMQAFEAEHLPSQTEKPIVLHCGSGMRSRKVAEICMKAGATKMAHMAGGFNAWKEAGLTYTGTDPATGGPKEMRKQG